MSDKLPVNTYDPKLIGDLRKALKNIIHEAEQALDRLPGDVVTNDSGGSPPPPPKPD